MEFYGVNLVSVVIQSLSRCWTNLSQHLKPPSHTPFGSCTMAPLCVWILVSPNSQIDIHQSQFHTMVLTSTKMGCIFFWHECHASALTKIWQCDTNWHIGLPHNASKGWVHSTIHHVPIDYDFPKFPCLGCAFCFSLASLEEALAQPLVMLGLSLHTSSLPSYPQSLFAISIFLITIVLTISFKGLRGKVYDMRLILSTYK
jgi:hypothetical protein